MIGALKIVMARNAPIFLWSGPMNVEYTSHAGKLATLFEIQDQTGMLSAVMVSRPASVSPDISRELRLREARWA